MKQLAVIAEGGQRREEHAQKRTRHDKLAFLGLAGPSPRPTGDMGGRAREISLVRVCIVVEFNNVEPLLVQMSLFCGDARMPRIRAHMRALQRPGLDVQGAT